MADTWTGPSATVGLVTYAYSSDNTAIRFSRTDNAPFPAGLGDKLAHGLVEALLARAAELEVIASNLDALDNAFATTCRNRAAAYRTAAGS